MHEQGQDELLRLVTHEGKFFTVCKTKDESRHPVLEADGRADIIWKHCMEHRRRELLLVDLKLQALDLLVQRVDQMLVAVLGSRQLALEAQVFFLQPHGVSEGVLNRRVPTWS
jgi:hypothetical protein